MLELHRVGGALLWCNQGCKSQFGQEDRPSHAQSKEDKLMACMQCQMLTGTAQASSWGAACIQGQAYICTLALVAYMFALVTTVSWIYTEDEGRMVSSWIVRTHCCVEWYMRYFSEVCQVLQQPNFGCSYGWGCMCQSVQTGVRTSCVCQILCVPVIFFLPCMWCFLCTRVFLVMCISRLP